MGGCVSEHNGKVVIDDEGGEGCNRKYKVWKEGGDEWKRSNHDPSQD